MTTGIKVGEIMIGEDKREEAAKHPIVYISDGDNSDFLTNDNS